MKAKGFPLKITVIALVSVFVFVGVSTVFLFEETNEQNNLSVSEIKKAAIIDQLRAEIPNEHFMKRSTQYLEDAGYEVDYITTENITVNFYKKLPTMGYDFIVIRSHAVGQEDEEVPVALFTGEKYTTDKYISEQLFEQVKKGTTLLSQLYKIEAKESDWIVVNSTYRYLSTKPNVVEESDDEYFLIAPKLVDELMEGRFSGTTFILGGCSTLGNTSMAESLIRRGASTVVGWTDLVGSYQNDKYILLLLKEILINKIEVNEAVDNVMLDFTLHPKYPAKLTSYS